MSTISSTGSTSSISGLASGLDTASIISQLMQLEAIPQNRLKAQLSSEQTALTSLQSLNAKVASFAIQAKAAATAASWAPTQVTSSLAGVAVSATGTGGASLDLHVQQVASAARVSFGTTVRSSDVVVTTGVPAQLTVGGTTSTLTTGDGTIGSIAAAINNGGYGVTATTITQADGTQRLLIQSSTTGAQALSLTGVDGLGTATTTAGQDAQIVVGSDTLSSPTNTFSAVSGLSITVSAAAVGQDAHVAVTNDPTAARAQAKSLVDNLNAILDQADAGTAYNAASKTQGPLGDDGAVGSLQTALFRSVFPTDGTTLASVGIQTDRYGRLTFDPAAFDKAYQGDPGSVAKALGGPTGFAARIQTVADAASNSVSGSLTASVTSRNSEIRRTQAGIADWDVRLQLKQQTLTTTYTALETALSKLNSQSSWLTSQLNSLNGTSSSSK
ncbi:flagellar filament capping protein FliD [Lapillicoccus jejuensis]|uniref:Flagellar hook-associated protein 2 n=1 Tax=Lapillicoccus jejuensis TaxID=402171 RepID=A0A542E4A0_9MICO|nr:flagellar filament capping protein FliD [Lapillicoccus jejuensis]TQJ10172.1 flagellar hook-associated protein 2 [Lapillicoccus jejuensis]